MPRLPTWAFRSGHLHGSDGFVGLVLVGMEIDKPAGARGTGGRVFQDCNAHGGARELVPMIVDELPDLIVHLEGAHFGSSPAWQDRHFDGAGAGGKFTTISGQYLDKLKVFQVRLLRFVPGAAAIGNHTVVEHGRIPTGGHLFGKVSVELARRAGPSWGMCMPVAMMRTRLLMAPAMGGRRGLGSNEITLAQERPPKGDPQTPQGIHFTGLEAMLSTDRMWRSRLFGGTRTLPNLPERAFLGVSLVIRGFQQQLFFRNALGG